MKIGSALALALLLGGCATAQRPPEADALEPALPPLPPARIERLHAVAGVFYSAEFTQGTIRDRGAPEIFHRPGPASVALFDQVLASAFERVVRLPAWPPSGPGSAEVSVVFVPRIAGIATLREAPGRTTTGYSSRLIEYAVELYTDKGSPLDSWKIYARSRIAGPSEAGNDTLYALALRDAAAQLLSSIAQRHARPAQSPVPVPAAVANTGATSAPAPGRPIRLAIASVLEPGGTGERKPGHEGSCFADALAKALPQVSIVPAERIRDAVFPWLEASTLMDTAQRMPELIRHRAVREAFAQTGVDYLALLGAERTSNRNPDALRCDTTYRAPGCSGVRGDALKTRLRVTLWNLRRFTMSANFEVESAGSGTIAGLAVPIAGTAQFSASACERAAEAIRPLIARP